MSDVVTVPSWIFVLMLSLSTGAAALVLAVVLEGAWQLGRALTDRRRGSTWTPTEIAEWRAWRDRRGGA